MFYIDDEPLDFRRTDDERVKFVLDSKKEIMAKKDYVVIKRLKTDSKLMKDDKGRILREPFTTIPCRWVVNGERGTEFWRWAQSRTSRTSKGNTVYNYDPTHIILNDEMHLNPVDDWEKVFFFTRIVDVRTCGCFIYDAVDESKKKNEMVAGDELDARYMLFRNPETTEEKIRTVARAWGIEDAEECQIDVLKSKLWETVVMEDKRIDGSERGFKNFVRDFQNDDKTQMRAILYKAIHNDVIEYVSLQKGWFYKSTGELIVRVPQERIPRKFELLIEYFSSHIDLYENLYIDMKGEKITPKYSVADIEMMSDMPSVRIAAKHMRVELPVNIKLENAKQRLVDSLL